MKEMLHDLFAEIGLHEHAKAVLDAKHKFTLKNYMQIFELEIKRNDLIITVERARELQHQYNILKWETAYGSYH